jgi:hypothetical protein
MKWAIEIAGYTLAAVLVVVGVLGALGRLPDYLPPVMGGPTVGVGVSLAICNVGWRFRRPRA